MVGANDRIPSEINIVDNNESNSLDSSKARLTWVADGEKKSLAFRIPSGAAMTIDDVARELQRMGFLVEQPPAERIEQGLIGDETSNIVETSTGWKIQFVEYKCIRGFGAEKRTNLSDCPCGSRDSESPRRVVC
jgi:hypothetical protein